MGCTKVHLQGGLAVPHGFQKIQIKPELQAVINCGQAPPRAAEPTEVGPKR